MTLPWRSNTTEDISSQTDTRYETPGGAQKKVDDAFNAFKNEVELPIRNESIVERHLRTENVSTRTIAKKAVTRDKIATGAVGFHELDPLLYTDINNPVVEAKFQLIDEQLADITLNVKAFGAVGNANYYNSTSKIWYVDSSFTIPSTNDTIAIQNAMDYAIANKCNLLFPDGRYLVDDLIYLKWDDSYLSTITFGTGAVLIQKTSTNYAITISGKKINVQGINVRKHADAVYGVKIGWLWYSNFSNPILPATIISSGPDGFGTFWNTFTHCIITKLFFDITEGHISHNSFTGTEIRGIELSEPGRPPSAGGGISDFYNNVFTGIDVVGTVINRHPVHPFIFKQCNLEGAFTVTGLVKHEGGMLAPYTGSSFTDYNPKSKFETDGGYAVLSYNYNPVTGVNLCQNGDAHDLSSNISGSQATISVIDTPDNIIDNGRVFRSYGVVGTDFPFQAIALPLEYLPLAKKLGYVSFDFWIKVKSGFSNIITNTGGADSYYASTFSVKAGELDTWKHCFVQVQVPASATKVEVKITGTSAASGLVKEWYTDAVGIYMGKNSYPFTKSPKDRHNQEIFTSIAQTGATTSLLSFDIPLNRAGVVKVYMRGSGSTAGMYSNAAIRLIFERGESYTTGTKIVKDGLIVPASAPGSITDITATLSSNTVIIGVTMATYPPNFTATIKTIVEYEFDYKPTITKI